MDGVFEGGWDVDGVFEGGGIWMECLKGMGCGWSV